MTRPFSRPFSRPLSLLRVAALAVLLLPAAAFLAAFGSGGLFAPKADPWPRWSAHDPQSTADVDHAPWQAILKQYLVRGADGVNRFAYARVSDADRRRLDSYLAALSVVAVDDHGRDAQRAFWINLYNALTVQVVLDHYPVATIRDIDISPGLFADGPWDRKLIEVEGERLSLNDIEHRILRPIWADPRLHYALNCASVGCPDLQNAAFTAANGEALLEKAAHDFVGHPRGVRVDGDSIVVSKIYTWFPRDFGADERAVRRHIARYAAGAVRDAVLTLEDVRSEYDWSLNDADPR